MAAENFFWHETAATAAGCQMFPASSARSAGQQMIQPTQLRGYASVLVGVK
jgi:hypothetical protein